MTSPNKVPQETQQSSLEAIPAKFWSVSSPLQSFAVGGAMAEMPRLARETELHKMLTDEKMRSEQHKTNYQSLKAEHQWYAALSV